MSLSRKSSDDKLVYFVRPIGRQGPVKIGCSVQPRNRLLTMQAWSPDRLELVATAKGRNAHEQMIHARFIADRSHGEWFNWSPELEALMTYVREHQALPAEYDNPPRQWGEWKAFNQARPVKMSKGSALMAAPELARVG